jgi:hypothetical protein
VEFLIDTGDVGACQPGWDFLIRFRSRRTSVVSARPEGGGSGREGEGSRTLRRRRWYVTGICPTPVGSQALLRTIKALSPPSVPDLWRRIDPDGAEGAATGGFDRLPASTGAVDAGKFPEGVGIGMSSDPEARQRAHKAA